MLIERTPTLADHPSHVSTSTSRIHQFDPDCRQANQVLQCRPNHKVLQLTSAMSPLGSRPTLVVSANVMAVLFGAALIWLARKLGADAHARSLNYLVCLLGVLVGWAIGILASPLTAGENLHFITLAQAVSAFVSGYLVSKVDRFLERALYVEDRPNYPMWVRVGLFCASLLLMTTIVFVNRSYIHTIPSA